MTKIEELHHPVGPGAIRKMEEMLKTQGVLSVRVIGKAESDDLIVAKNDGALEVYSLLKTRYRLDL